MGRKGVRLRAITLGFRSKNIETIHRSPSLCTRCPTTRYLPDCLNHLSFRRVSPTAHCAFLLVARLYNKDMKSTRVILGISLLLAGGCHQHPLTDYRPLDQAGMGSGTIEQLKPLNISDAGSSATG